MKVERIQNTELHHAWRARRKRVADNNDGDPNDQILFHGTGARPPTEVVAASEGLDPRNSKSKGNFYGVATYLSEDPAYGLGTGPYAYRVPGHDGRRQQLLVVRLAAGAVKEYGTMVTEETKALNMPPVRDEGPPVVRYDTVKVGGKTRGRGRG